MNRQYLNFGGIGLRMMVLSFGGKPNYFKLKWHLHLTFLDRRIRSCRLPSPTFTLDLERRKGVRNPFGGKR